MKKNKFGITESEAGQIAYGRVSLTRLGMWAHEAMIAAKRPESQVHFGWHKAMLGNCSYMLYSAIDSGKYRLDDEDNNLKIPLKLVLKFYKQKNPRGFVKHVLAMKELRVLQVSHALKLAA